jgi:chorismate mutase
MRKHNSSSIRKVGVSNLNNIDFRKGLKTCRRLVVLMEIKEELREMAMMYV